MKLFTPNMVKRSWLLIRIGNNIPQPKTTEIIEVTSYLNFQFLINFRWIFSLYNI